VGEIYEFNARRNEEDFSSKNASPQDHYDVEAKHPNNASGYQKRTSTEEFI
jgi:hypothetical protein